MLPVGAVAAAWLEAYPALQSAMAAKRRAVFPLRTLLADDALAAPGIDFVLADAACAGTLTGASVDATVWDNSSTADTDSAFLFLHIPREAVPERVLEVLAGLRR